MKKLILLLALVSVALAGFSTDRTGAATVGVEARIPADSGFRVVCISATQWILTVTTKLGAVLTALVPDPIEP